MAHIFEGEPDGRQAGAIAVTRFRPRYRALTDQEKAAHDAIKAAFEAVEVLVNQLDPGRYRSLAITTLEESCMWAVKQLTS